MPFVYKVVQSDLFLKDTKDQGSQISTTTPLTELAFTHCNNYIKSKLGANSSINFSEKPLNAWSIGNFQYVINAEIGITSATTGTINKKYVCRINFNNGETNEGALDFANWSIEGLSGIDSI